MTSTSDFPPLKSGHNRLCSVCCSLWSSAKWSPGNGSSSGPLLGSPRWPQATWTFLWIWAISSYATLSFSSVWAYNSRIFGLPSAFIIQWFHILGIAFNHLFLLLISLEKARERCVHGVHICNKLTFSFQTYISALAISFCFWASSISWSTVPKNPPIIFLISRYFRWNSSYLLFNSIYIALIMSTFFWLTCSTSMMGPMDRGRPTAQGCMEESQSQEYPELRRNQMPPALL